MHRPTIAIGFVGPTLDVGRGPERWSKWRPTICLGQQDDLLLDRVELLYQRPFTTLTEQLIEDFKSVSPQTEVRGHVIGIEDPWDFEEVYGALHDWAESYPFKPEDEDYLIHITTGSHVTQICLFLLTESRRLPGKLVQTSPPRRNEASCGHHEIIDLDLSRYDRLAARFQREHQEGLSFLKSGIDTRNPAFNALIERIERVAISSAAPLLLMGPTGSGKSHLARRIYELKKARRQVSGAFVEVNCATLRGDAAMSALFGHVKGAFTGALQDRAGLLRAANDGVLFLDEVGELGPDEQAMLLRAIEEKRFLPVGSDKEVRSSFQLIAGTNRDLSADVRTGRFREDLLARINLWTFRLPALRERREDIEPNLRYELEQFARSAGASVTFNKEARERFLRFASSPEAVWSGNFRDLNAAVTRMATLAAGGRITVEIVEDEVQRLRDLWGPAPDESSPTSDLTGLIDRTTLEAIDPFDRVQLAEVVRVCRQSRSLSEAGRTLFSASRLQKQKPNDADRLRKYLSRFKLDWNSVTSA